MVLGGKTQKYKEIHGKASMYEDRGGGGEIKVNPTQTTAKENHTPTMIMIYEQLYIAK